MSSVAQDELSKLTNEQLRSRLLNHGLGNVIVTSSTRNILINRLREAMDTGETIHEEEKTVDVGVATVIIEGEKCGWKHGHTKTDVVPIVKPKTTRRQSGNRLREAMDTGETIHEEEKTVDVGVATVIIEGEKCGWKHGHTKTDVVPIVKPKTTRRQSGNRLREAMDTGETIHEEEKTVDVGVATVIIEGEKCGWKHGHTKTDVVPIVKPKTTRRQSGNRLREAMDTGETIHEEEKTVDVGVATVIIEGEKCGWKHGHTKTDVVPIVKPKTTRRQSATTAANFDEITVDVEKSIDASIASKDDTLAVALVLAKEITTSVTSRFGICRIDDIAKMLELALSELLLLMKSVAQSSRHPFENISQQLQKLVDEKDGTLKETFIVFSNAILLLPGAIERSNYLFVNESTVIEIGTAAAITSLRMNSHQPNAGLRLKYSNLDDDTIKKLLKSKITESKILEQQHGASLIMINDIKTEIGNRQQNTNSDNCLKKWYKKAKAPLVFGVLVGLGIICTVMGVNAESMGIAFYILFPIFVILFLTVLIIFFCKIAKYCKRC